MPLHPVKQAYVTAKARAEAARLLSPVLGVSDEDARLLIDLAKAEEALIQWAEKIVQAAYGKRYDMIRPAFESRTARVHPHLRAKLISICLDLPEQALERETLRVVARA